MSQPVASLTGEELGGWADIRQLARKGEAWYRQSLLRDGAPMTIRNNETGWEISFNNIGRKKLSGRKGEDIYRAVVALPDILRYGVLVSSEADRKGRPDIKAVHKIGASVEISGRKVALVATFRETRDGRFHYDLSTDTDGGRSETAVRRGDAKLRRSALEGTPVDINISLAGTEINSDPDMPTARARAVNDAARKELAKVGIATRVRAEAASGKDGVSGTYRRGVISILKTGGNWRHTLDHEIIHALRDGDLWERDYGLFTAEEGRAEEMVAELYADWAQGRRDEASGPLGRALQRIQDFFRAVARAFRGEGMTEAAQIMERIANGEIGRRGPDGPGGGRRGEAKEQRDMSGIKDQRTTSFQQNPGRSGAKWGNCWGK